MSEDRIEEYQNRYEQIAKEHAKEVEMILAEFAKDFDPSALKTRQGGGGRNFTYVDHAAVTRRLIRATKGNYTWQIKDWKILREEGAARGGAPVMLVHGRLEVPQLGAVIEEMGVQVIQPNGGEDQYKGAASDALKRACMRLGVALGLYGEDVEGAIAAQAQVATGIAAATVRAIPEGVTALRAALKEQADRLTPVKMKEESLKRFGKANMRELDEAQLKDILRWAYEQAGEEG